MKRDRDRGPKEGERSETEMFCLYPCLRVTLYVSILLSVLVYGSAYPCTKSSVLSIHIHLSVVIYLYICPTISRCVCACMCVCVWDLTDDTPPPAPRGDQQNTDYTLTIMSNDIAIGANAYIIAHYPSAQFHNRALYPER